MKLQCLKWTKSVRRNDDEWAYSEFKEFDLFKLAWKTSESNANRPEKDDLILLRQKGFVTHLVKVLDYKAESQTGKGDYDIYRIVEVIKHIDFNNPPALAKADSLFDYSEFLKYEGGNVMKLEELPSFKKRWDQDGGIETFQSRIQDLF